jgi:cell fate regulator YaaT (PSP1 superfamily)
MENNSINIPNVVGIRFSPIGKSYFFDASKIEGIKNGDNIVVETSRGWQLGQVVQIVEDKTLRSKMRYKPVNRLATEDDLKKKDYLDSKGIEALEFCRKISPKNSKGVKIISAEFSFDESSLTFLYSTENENRINFNNEIKDIKNKYRIKKIDFHKIGPRDVAKYLCGMGACGLEKRCCSQFLGNFESISIRMAKTQGISLTPSDITGMCNRLKCCLSFEYCNYVEALKGMPKKNKRVNTPMGPGKVRDVAPLSKTVFVKLDDHGMKEFDAAEVNLIQPNQQNTQKPGSGKSGQGNKPQKNTRKNFQNRRKRNSNTKNNKNK